jgi:hypothetical protein
MTDLTPERIMHRRAHLHWFVEERVPEWAPTFTLDEHIAEARERRGAEFQAEVDRQWDEFPARVGER